MEDHQTELTAGKIHKVKHDTAKDKLYIAEQNDHDSSGSIDQDEILKLPETDLSQGLSSPEDRPMQLKDKSNLRCYILSFCLVSLVICTIY